MRAEMLGAIEYVDYVGINFEPSAENVLTTMTEMFTSKVPITKTQKKM